MVDLLAHPAAGGGPTRRFGPFEYVAFYDNLVEVPTGKDGDLVRIAEKRAQDRFWDVDYVDFSGERHTLVAEQLVVISDHEEG